MEGGLFRFYLGEGGGNKLTPMGILVPPGVTSKGIYVPVKEN